MFRIYDKSMSDEEMLAIAYIWPEMHGKLINEIVKCGDEVCGEQNCKYNRLCDSLGRTYSYIDKVLKERGLEANWQ